MYPGRSAVSPIIGMPLCAPRSAASHEVPERCGSRAGARSWPVSRRCNPFAAPLQRAPRRKVVSCVPTTPRSTRCALRRSARSRMRADRGPTHTACACTHRPPATTKNYRRKSVSVISIRFSGANFASSYRPGNSISSRYGVLRDYFALGPAARG